MAKWHKLKKAQQKAGKSSPHDMKKMMKKMQRQGQMDFDEIQNVQEVIIRTAEKEIVIEGPQVTKIEVPGQGEVFQVIGKGVDRARTGAQVQPEEEAQPVEDSTTDEMKVTPADAQLVSLQAGVSMEEAMAALKQTNGDLAKAILLLKQRNV
jgi:nascent polypeptide-associated complex subunit alpha